ncbi:hypothetical protein MKZ38_001870 [Zalerion maritima]|uniref:Nickel/cobalt efflux system n=1 Tax=Zalerion maritima TaxID=339359 RepID=A0AAD5RPU2_9PEZI|nr:hypothetical protein MKZ38_001870 [Zalerion maritima]
MTMARITHLCRPLPPLPGPLAHLPPSSLYIIALLVLVNLLVWSAVAAPLHLNPSLISPAVLSYTLGLRHALDADHIAAIDLVTRRLIAEGQRPVAVGTFFSLGHSTVVILTCVVVAATAGALSKKFDDFQRVGAIIGTSVSAAFLLLLCAANAWILWKLVGRLRGALREEREEVERRQIEGESDDDAGDAVAAHGTGQAMFEGVGCLSRVFKSLFKIVDRPWKMLPLGFCFGLGFDTSSEIAVLGIASIEGAKGRSLWLILIFPALFTEVFSRDRIAILYYSVVLTGITVTVSAFIGIIQLLTLIYNVKGEPEGPGWDGLAQIGDHSEIIGGSVCGLFVVIGVSSAIAYKPWRRRAVPQSPEDGARESVPC